MLDLYEPEEEEVLELLVPLFLDEDVAPSEQGLHALRVALDAKFGTEHGAAPNDGAAVIPLRRGLARIVTGAAAAVVVLALVLAWYGWHQAPGPSPGRTKLEDATAALRTDLRNGSPQARIERAVTSLAGAMSTLPTNERTDMSTQPNQLIASACRWLEGSSAASQTPSTSLPQACHLEGLPPQSADTSTSSPEGGSGPGTTAHTGFTPDQASGDPWSGTSGQDPGGSPSRAAGPPVGTTPAWDGQDRPAPGQYDTAAPPTAAPTQSGWPSGAGGSEPTQSGEPQGGTGVPSSRSVPSTDPDSPHALSSYPQSSPSTVPTTPCSPDSCGGGSAADSSETPSSGFSWGSPHSGP